MLALIVLLLGHAEAFGFVADPPYWIRNRTVVMHLSLGGGLLQDGSPSYNHAAANALSTWNQHLVHLQFGWVIGSQLRPADGDGDNSVFFADNIYGDSFGNRTLAITLTSSRASGTTEGEVIFNSREAWDSYRGPSQLEAHDLYRVALHEFGHVLGLNHPDQSGQNVNALMNSRIGNLDTLSQDDINGAHSIYDGGPSFLSTNPSPNLVNLSTRALVGTGDRVLIGGFIIQGSQPATVILRAVGSSLGSHGITNPLADPVIELRTGTGALIAENDDWVSGGDSSTIASYRLDPPGSLESALLQTLAPGNYTAIVSGFDNGAGPTTGVALVELYDLTTGGRAGNISSRGQVLFGNDVMIAGFIVGGPSAKEVIIRALGPSLSGAGVGGALPDPSLEVRDGNGELVRSNDDWNQDAGAAQIAARGFAPASPKESALLLTLAPGAYTSIVRGVNGATGIALVEVYDQSAPPN